MRKITISNLLYIVPLLYFMLLVVAAPIRAQTADNKLLDFADIQVTQNIVFSKSVPQPLSSAAIPSVGIPKNANVPEHETSLVDLKMHVYEPKGDDRTDRPVLILCFGSGFTEGSKEAGDMNTLAEHFARKGFVTATIDYRLGLNIFDDKAADRSIYRATQDSRAAVRFFRQSKTTGDPYRIASDKIFVAGPSAGGMAALHNVYLDENERTPSTFKTTYSYGQNPLDKDTYEIQDLECLDCAGQYRTFSGKANGAIAFAGALGDLDFLNSSADVPVLLFHSEDDPIVPFNSGKPYDDSPFTRIPVIYGSNSIFIRSKVTGSPVTLKSYTDRQHQVHSPLGTTIYPDVLEDMEVFLSEQLQSKVLSTETPLLDLQQIVFANPIRQAIPWKIHIDAESAVKSITVTTIQGQILQKLSITETDKTIELAPIADQGLYLVTLFSSKSRKGKLSTKKLLVY